MRLVLFRTKGADAAAQLRVGAQHAGGGVADISAAAADQGLSLHSMRVFLEMGAAGAALAQAALANPAYLRPAEHVELRAPIYDSCVGQRPAQRPRLPTRQPHPPPPLRSPLLAHLPAGRR